ncbi:MAG TPA: DegT/DnrJ/EryC1/StrS family aminotransferase [Bacteroides sp.]|nr:DegT/DnrJ/EryC1/StrS family aminotransferase [Bacteroides sp.]
MKEIQMVDLHGQYLKIRTEVDEAIQRVIDSTAFIKGKEVFLFQDELSAYTGAGHTIACGNGTDALQVAMMALEIKPGDEVITTPFTFISTIEVIKLLGMKPLLVDVEKGSFNMDPLLLRDVITERTKAIVPVHLFGQCAHMEPIMELAAEHGLFVIEDNAQAIGADYLFSDGSTRKAGTIGNVGTTSFFPSKNLGAYGDGGALFTNDQGLAEKISALVNHGMKQRYYYDYVGINSRLDTLQAAILRVKLKQLPAYHLARQQAALFYDEAFSGIAGLNIPERSPYSTHVFHQYTIRVPREARDPLKEWLAGKKIPSMVYYPVPLHLQHAYADLGYGAGDFPVAEKLSQEVLSLPMHTELDAEQLSYIAAEVRAFFKL